MEMKSSLDKEETNQQILVSVNIAMLFSSKLYQVKHKERPDFDFISYVKDRVKRMARENKNQKHINMAENWITKSQFITMQ